MPRSFKSALIPLCCLIALAAAPLIAIWLGNPFVIRLMTRILLLGMVAMALNLALGFGGLVSLMHASLFGVGGYVVAILETHHFNAEALIGAFDGTAQLLLSLPLAVIACAAVAAITGLVALRTSGLFFIMITLAFNQMIYYLFVALQKYGGEDGLQMLGPVDLLGLTPSRRLEFYYLCLLLIAAVWVGLTRVVRSPFGLTLRGIAQNERRMRALGIEPLRYKLAAFVLSGAIAGLAGGLWAASQSFMSPADMTWGRSGELVVMAVLGGSAAVGGPLLGTAVFVLLEFFLSELTQRWMLPFGALIILMIALCPKGIVSLFGAAGLWRRRKVKP
jgi:branched-chain amino acid transport system permease protein